MSNQTISVRMIAQKGRPNPAGLIPIFARIKVGNEVSTISTKTYIEPDKWGMGKTIGTTRELKAINAMLEEMRFKIYQKHTEMIRCGEDVSIEKLKLALQGKSHNNDCRYFVQLFDRWLEEYQKQVGISTSQRTYQKYVVVRDRLQAYIKKTTSLDDILLTDVTPMFLNGFDTDNRLENEVAHNHAMKQMQKLRTIYKTAIDNGWVQKNPFASIKIRFEDVEREFLTKEELARIMQKEFPTERMEHIRDVFIFCCFTGLSHCDVLKLHQEDIRTDDNGNLWIHTHRNKTDVAVDVPLLEIPQMILAKYKNKRKLRSRLLPVISNGCTNVYLKELGEACGIRKNITFHMARHTFATTVTLTNGVPIESVCKMLGHRNIRTTQIYAKVINEKIAQDMSLLASRIGSDYSMPRTKKRATA